jgi:hypothetical protein
MGPTLPVRTDSRSTFRSVRRTVGGMSGIPVEAIEFYAELAGDNSREFWTANKSRYDAVVRAVRVPARGAGSGVR